MTTCPHGLGSHSGWGRKDRAEIRVKGALLNFEYVKATHMGNTYNLNKYTGHTILGHSPPTHVHPLDTQITRPSLEIATKFLEPQASCANTHACEYIHGEANISFIFLLL